MEQLGRSSGREYDRRILADERKGHFLRIETVAIGPAICRADGLLNRMGNSSIRASGGRSLLNDIVGLRRSQDRDDTPVNDIT